MNREMLMEYLKKETPEETYYRRCQQLRDRPYELRAYLRTDQARELRETGCVTDNKKTDKIPMLPLNEPGKDVYPRTLRIVKDFRYRQAFLHTHDFFELVYVLDGTCSMVVSGTQNLLAAGDICMMGPGTVHSIAPEGESVVMSLLVSIGIMESFFTDVLHGNGMISEFFAASLYQKKADSHLIFHTSGDEEALGQFLDMYMEEFQNEEYADRIIGNMVQIFLAKLARRYKKTVEGPMRVKGSMGNTIFIMRYIMEHYDTATLSELASSLNYSVSHCSRYVKSYTGCSFSSLQRRVRFQKAKEYLLNTDMSVAQIGSRLGYITPENFMRMFKKESGISPTQFRQQRRKLK